MSTTVKRGPGRPRVYKGLTRYHMGSVIRKHGLTRALKVLEARGTKVSLAVLRAVAKEQGIKLALGRPKLAA